jgi:hypothetical protein
MITALTAVLFLGAFTVATAQVSPTTSLFDKYNGKDGYTTVSISKDLFGLFADIDASDPEAQEMKDMMGQLEGIRILMYEAESESDAELSKFRGEIGKFNLEGFSELMVVKEKDEEVKFLALKKGDKIGELLLLINEPKEAGFISITGLIDLNTVAKLSQTMKMEGMENLEKLEEQK